MPARPARAPAPFGPESRTGFELELLAPRGSDRRALAEAIASRVGGVVRFGFKYQSEGPWHDGRPICDLTPAYRVLDAEGKWLCDIVDDVTIAEELEKGAPTKEGLYRVILDDLRLALWAERRCWADSHEPEIALASYLATFEGTLGRPGEDGAQHPAHRVASDPWGHALFVVGLYEGERERPAEIVTRPLLRAERLEVVASLLLAARELGFTIPVEAALHVHLDRDPWMETARLRRLILDVNAARSMLWEELKPNPRRRRLGPFSENMVKAAKAARDDDPLGPFLAALSEAGATKYADVNLLGLLRERPRHPTLEVRCLPMSLDAREVLAKVEAVEELLAGIVEAAGGG